MLASSSIDLFVLLLALVIPDGSPEGPSPPRFINASAMGIRHCALPMHTDMFPSTLAGKVLPSGFVMHIWLRLIMPPTTDTGEGGGGDTGSQHDLQHKEGQERSSISAAGETAAAGAEAR